jgi:hypothetical protein
MRWRTKRAMYRKTRVKSRKFLFFPKEIEGEVRWLERASWVERMDKIIYEFTPTKYYWEAERWL